MVSWRGMSAEGGPSQIEVVLIGGGKSKEAFSSSFQKAMRLVRGLENKHDSSSEIRLWALLNLRPKS